MFLLAIWSKAKIRKKAQKIRQVPITGIVEKTSWRVTDGVLEQLRRKENVGRKVGRDLIILLITSSIDTRVVDPDRSDPAVFLDSDSGCFLEGRIRVISNRISQIKYKSY